MDELVNNQHVTIDIEKARKRERHVHIIGRLIAIHRPEWMIAVLCFVNVTTNLLGEKERKVAKRRKKSHRGK